MLAQLIGIWGGAGNRHYHRDDDLPPFAILDAHHGDFTHVRVLDQHILGGRVAGTEGAIGSELWPVVRVPGEAARIAGRSRFRVDIGWSNVALNVDSAVAAAL